jgi:replicative DNA helicase
MSNTIAVEQEILGAILLSESAYWDVADFLTPESFTTKDHQAIFKAMADLARGNRAIRTVALSARLGTMENDVEPLVYMAKLVEIAKAAKESGGVPVAENAEDLARGHVRRQISALLKRVEKTAASPTADPFEILDGLIGQASDLVHEADQQIERSVGQVGGEVRKLLQEAIEKQGIGLTTGLHTLDDMIGRIFPGDFVLFGGQPGGGKTAAAMQIALHIAKTEPVGFIELEMESRMLLLRTIASETGIPVRRMLDGVKEGQFVSATDAIQKLSDRKLHMVAQRGMTITQVEARARSMKRRLGIKALVVDHLGLIKRPGKYRMAKHDKDFDNAEDLMELGKALGLPIIALCHLTKAARQKEGDPEPVMEDFSGGGMEQHADLMLCTFNRYEWLLKNKPKTKGKAAEDWQADLRTSQDRMEIYKLKDRKGAMRERRILHWDGSRTLFSDLPDPSRQAELIAMEEEMPF